MPSSECSDNEFLMVVGDEAVPLEVWGVEEEEGNNRKGVEAEELLAWSEAMDREVLGFCEGLEKLGRVLIEDCEHIEFKRCAKHPRPLRATTTPPQKPPLFFFLCLLPSLFDLFLPALVCFVCYSMARKVLPRNLVNPPVPTMPLRNGKITFPALVI